MIALLHSSKTMRSPREHRDQMQTPVLLDKSTRLAKYIQTLTTEQLAVIMKVSPALAQKTHDMFAQWSTADTQQSLAIDSFVGDIYSGLQASDLQLDDRLFAQDHLRILSGLYGILRPLDGIMPYRLEMAYRLPDKPFANLYDFWGDTIAHQLPETEMILNLTAVEYSKTITPFVDAQRIISPRFLTRHPKTHEPTFVVVHAKIARGAFAHWMIKRRINDVSAVSSFADLGYVYDSERSTTQVPVFICDTFGGLGLSVRLEK